MTEQRDDRATMRSVDHTHPHTDAPFGDSGVYDRGPEEGADDADREAAAENESVRPDGGTEPPVPQPGWAVHDLSGDER